MVFLELRLDSLQPWCAGIMHVRNKGLTAPGMIDAHTPLDGRNGRGRAQGFRENDVYRKAIQMPSVEALGALFEQDPLHILRDVW